MSDAETAWVRGDLSGVPIPAHSAALREAGTAYLTRAFQASGALGRDNRVTRITQFEDWRGGSTGRKLLLSVAYEKPSPALHTELFVKFSRDFGDRHRDRAKRQMESEVRFAALSRAPGFPIAVPACLFADYHGPSGTGILITERIAFGSGAIEPHQDKCRDYRLAHPLEHYRALIRALARLAGSHQGGRLPAAMAAHFPFDVDRLTVSERPPLDADQIRTQVARYAQFAARCPSLLPPGIRDPAFLSRLAREAVRFPPHERAIRQFLKSEPKLIALCHWNANIDNAWFWRNARGELDCGLLDWGHVGQMNVAMALWGALSAAELALWENHLDELLALFVAEFQACGGATLAASTLRLHLELYIALMGLAWLLDVPAFLEARVPDLTTLGDRLDPRIEADEHARVRLHMMSLFLDRWRSQELGGTLERFLEQSTGAESTRIPY